MVDSALGSPIPGRTEELTRMMYLTRPLEFSRMATQGDVTFYPDSGLTRPLGGDVTAWLGEKALGVAATKELFTDFLNTVSSCESGALGQHRGVGLDSG